MSKSFQVGDVVGVELWPEDRIVRELKGKDYIVGIIVAESEFMHLWKIYVFELLGVIPSIHPRQLTLLSRGKPIEPYEAGSEVHP